MEVQSDSFSRTKMSMPVVQHESAVRFCRPRPPSTRTSDVGAYLFEGARECLHPPVGVEAVRMGRESSTNLEQAALSFLSAIDPERGIDAALFLRRTGLVLASWTREGIRLDVVSVMAATMLASIQATSFLIGAAIMAGLKHPVRRRIYDHLVRLPGDHFRSVARSLDIAIGTARYHLAALLRDGLVYREDTNGRARYYVKAGAADVNRLYAQHWEFRDVRLRIVGALRRLERAQPATISKVLGISRQLVSYHLVRLEKAGRVRREGSLYRLVAPGPARGAHDGKVRLGTKP